MDSLTTPRRFKEADILEERKAKCEAASILSDRKKFGLLERNKFKQYLLALKDETNLFPVTLQIQCTQRLLQDMLTECVNTQDLAEAVSQIEVWTQLLFPWTNPSLGAVQLLEARKPSFTPILGAMLQEERLDATTGSDGEENPLEELMREQESESRAAGVYTHIPDLPASEV